MFSSSKEDLVLLPGRQLKWGRSRGSGLELSWLKAGFQFFIEHWWVSGSLLLLGSSPLGFHLGSLGCLLEPLFLGNTWIPVLVSTVPCHLQNLGLPPHLQSPQFCLAYPVSWLHTAWGEEEQRKLALLWGPLFFLGTWPCNTQMPR